jgi:hypothetical protein
VFKLKKREPLGRFSFNVSVELKTAVTANVTIVPEPDLTGVAFRTVFHTPLHW